MKKLLFLTFLLLFTFGFAQQNNKSSLVIQNSKPLVSLTSISASPNPFSVKTRITFNSSKEQLIQFTVKNLLGKTVYLEPVDTKIGLNTIYFERNNISKGMYIYSLQSEAEIVSKRLVIK